MSIYSDLSKEISFSPRKVSIPSKEGCRDLLSKVINNDIDAFRTVFNIYRHAQSPTNNAGTEALNLITEAYQIGSHNQDWR